jgi:single-stranded DNA-binding protein
MGTCDVETWENANPKSSEKVNMGARIVIEVSSASRKWQGSGEPNSTPLT